MPWKPWNTAKITEEDIDKFGRFAALKASADINVAKAYFEKRDGKTYPIPRVRQKIDATLRNYIINDVFE